VDVTIGFAKNRTTFQSEDGYICGYFSTLCQTLVSCIGFKRLFTYLTSKRHPYILNIRTTDTFVFKARHVHANNLKQKTSANNLLNIPYKRKYKPLTTISYTQDLASSCIYRPIGEWDYSKSTSGWKTSLVGLHNHCSMFIRLTYYEIRLYEH
jgi:hypothetical protein